MSTDISDKIIAVLPEILPRLYPLGTIKGKEFRVGNIMGEAGDSLSINMKTGLWADYANPGMKGKILALFAARNNGSFNDGLKEVIQLLKLPPPIKSAKYKKPKKDWIFFTSIVSATKPIRYLINERKLDHQMLMASGVAYKDNEYVFLGYDEAGDLAYAQYTSCIRDEDGKKKVRFSVGPKMCLWGMNSVTENYDKLFITEGVIDALSFRTKGYNAVSIPGGVNSTEWIELSWNFLSQYETIYICFDSDEPGQKAANLAAGRIGVSRCKNLRFKAKDANDALLIGEDFEIAIQDASDFFPSMFISSGEIREKVWNEMLSGPPENTGDALMGWTGKSGPIFRIRPGESTIWTGYAGGGKSTALLQHIAYSVLVKNKKMALASLEMPSTMSLIKLITQACGFFIENKATFNAIYDRIADNIFIYDCIGNAKMADLINFFEYSIARHGVTEVILDSLMKTDIDIDGDKSSVAHLFDTLIDSCKKMQAHHHIVAHPTKGDDTDFTKIPSMNSVKGIQELTANVDNVLVVWRNKIKQGTIEGMMRKGSHEAAMKRDREWGDSRIIIAKNRIGQDLGKIEAWFNTSNYRFREEFEQDTDQPYIQL